MEPGTLLRQIAQSCVKIFGTTLTGVYLHGSLAMGCFTSAASDLDLLIVTAKPPSLAHKRLFLQEVLAWNARAPAKGLELSIVTLARCRRVAFPTRFEFHFSPMHLDACLRDPEGYLRAMRGADPDLPAHFAVVRARGVCLYGAPIADVFGPVTPQALWASLRHDLATAQTDVLREPASVLLNLCRTWALRETGAMLSKKEGGEWALARMDPAEGALIRQALACYACGQTAPFPSAPTAALCRALKNRAGL